MESLETVTSTCIEEVPFPHNDTVSGAVGNQNVFDANTFDGTICGFRMYYVFKVQIHAKNTLLLLPPLYGHRYIERICLDSLLKEETEIPLETIMQKRMTAFLQGNNVR